ncbi:hypothetical protein MNV49_006400 [Pseudohyphozyma bogoriensis]|nr:hypothetical protein MNV49_006400 [Pseudohyphozyma bogoriensis]
MAAPAPPDADVKASGQPASPSNASAETLKSTLIHSIPIADRPPLGYQVKATFFGILWAVFCVLLRASQIVMYPLSFVPGGCREGYWAFVDHTKSSFAVMLAYLSRSTTLVITCDDSINLEKVLVKNGTGVIKGFKFDDRAVWIANHQMYADWIYIWSLLNLSDLASSLSIVLKASLSRVPIAGPAMLLWKFIFLSPMRSSSTPAELNEDGTVKEKAKRAAVKGTWEGDKQATGNILWNLGRRAMNKAKPEKGGEKGKEGKVALLMFPEGTLVSPLTRPSSAKYAEKMGIKDCSNMLLPRSTGLLFALRTLLPTMPDLSLYDMTVGYPALPPAGHAQAYYSLRSIYLNDQGPPKVHIHLRALDLSTVPSLGNLQPGPDKKEEYAKKSTKPVEDDAKLTDKERGEFDMWLRGVWTEKDALLEGFYEKGEFECREGQRVEMRLGSRGIDDWLAIVITVVPVYVAWRGVVWWGKFFGYWR